jgi:hypothetical protein
MSLGSIILPCPECGKEIMVENIDIKVIAYNSKETLCSCSLHEIPRLKLSCTCFKEVEILTANLLLKFYE